MQRGLITVKTHSDGVTRRNYVSQLIRGDPWTPDSAGAVMSELTWHGCHRIHIQLSKWATKMAAAVGEKTHWLFLGICGDFNDNFTVKDQIWPLLIRFPRHNHINHGTMISNNFQ